jgi:hypothetical protein
MKTFVRLTMALAMLIPIGAITAGPAAAAAGTTCKPPSGTVKLTPGLTAKLTVQTITINLPVKGCVGGGVTGGTFKGSLKTAPISVATFAKASAPLKLKSTITWNTKATSTLTANSSTKIGKTIVSTVTGKISAGLFKGLTFKSVQTVTLGKPGAGGAITLLNIKGTGSITIR